MTRIIAVRPSPSGWAVHIEGDPVALAFPTGAQAEAAARNISGGFSQAGESTALHIYLRDGALAGRFLSPALARAS